MRFYLALVLAFVACKKDSSDEAKPAPAPPPAPEVKPAPPPPPAPKPAPPPTCAPLVIHLGAKDITLHRDADVKATKDSFEAELKKLGQQCVGPATLIAANDVSYQ